MRSLSAIILCTTAALALGACQQKDTTTAENKAADPAAAPAAATPATPAATAAAAPLTTMPTEALSAQAAVDAQKLRHDNFEKLGDAMKALSREAKAGSPDLAKVQANADIVLASATALPSWFAPGTGPEAGKTDAKAEIWKTSDDFKAKATKFYEAAQGLKTASTDAAAFKTSMAAVGGACKACHETYRVDD